MKPFLGTWERMVLLRDGYYSVDPRRSRRAGMLLALDRGTTLASVAKSAGCSRSTIYYWVNLYKQYRDADVLARENVSDPESKARLAVAKVCAEVNALVPRRPRRRRLPGDAAPLDREGRDALRRRATSEPRPRRKLAASMAWAIERGVDYRKVAEVAGVSRQGARQAWLRGRESGDGSRGTGVRGRGLMAVNVDEM